MGREKERPRGRGGSGPRRNRRRRPSEIEPRNLSAATRKRIRTKRRGAERVEGGMRRRKTELEIEVHQTMHRVEVEVALGMERRSGDVDIVVKEMDGGAQSSCSIVEEQAACRLETGQGSLSFSIDPGEVLLIDGKEVHDPDEALEAAAAALEGLTAPAALALMSTVEDLVGEQAEGEPDSRQIWEAVIRPILTVFREFLKQGFQALEGDAAIQFLYAFLWGVLGWWLFAFLPDTSTLLAEIEVGPLPSPASPS